jgi:steroid delta-isomerase-like uncharacterized protein
MGENEALMRRWFRDVWKAGGDKTVDELLAPEIEGFLEGQEIHSPQGFQDFRRQLLAAFPDLSVEVEDVVEQGHKVAIRWRCQATHTGGGLGVPATLKQVSFRGISWVEIQNGRIVRGWDSWNLGALLQSLGAAPAAGVN